MSKLLVNLSFVTILGLLSCKNSFEPIDYGHDACMHCRMTIIDNRFAAEILTEKGKAYKFDDIACLLNYLHEHKQQNADVKIYVANYSNPTSTFLDAFNATYVHNEQFKTAMNGNYAAFPSAQDATKEGEKSNPLKWSDLK